jgi:hypothetical protein
MDRWASGGRARDIVTRLALLIVIRVVIVAARIPAALLVHELAKRSPVLMPEDILVVESTKHKHGIDTASASFGKAFSAYSVPILHRNALIYGAVRHELILASFPVVRRNREIRTAPHGSNEAFHVGIDLKSRSFTRIDEMNGRSSGIFGLTINRAESKPRSFVGLERASALQKTNIDSNDADACHDSSSYGDVIESLSCTKLRAPAGFFFGVLIVILGSRFLTYGERLGNIHAELAWWVGYIIATIGGILAGFAVVSIAAHWTLSLLWKS